MNCSLYKPFERPDGRVVVVPVRKHTSLERIAAWVRDGAGPGDAAKYVLAARAAAEADDEPARRAAKNMLWGFTPAGVVLPASRRTKEGIVWQSRAPLVAIDVDHADGAPVLRDKLAKLPEVAAVWVSASGAGVKALLVVDDAGETAASYHRAWFAACCRLEQLGYVLEHHTKVDVPGSYWNGIQYLSLDPEAYYNAGATPLRVHDWPAPPERKPMRRGPDVYGPSDRQPDREVVHMLEHIRPHDLHWMGGPGEVSVLSMANALQDWDAAQGEGMFYDWLRQVGYDRNDPRDAWRRAQEGVSRVTFGSLVHWAKAGGWCEKSDGAARLRAISARNEVDLADESWMH